MNGMQLAKKQLETAERIMGYAAAIVSSERPDAIAIRDELMVLTAALTVAAIDTYMAIDSDSLEPHHCHRLNEIMIAIKTLITPILDAFDKWRAEQSTSAEFAAEKAAKEAIAKAMAKPTPNS